MAEVGITFDFIAGSTKKNIMIHNPKTLEKRLKELKTAVRNSIKKVKEEALFDQLPDRSLPVSRLAAIFLKFYKGFSGMMPIKSVGPFF